MNEEAAIAGIFLSLSLLKEKVEVISPRKKKIVRAAITNILKGRKKRMVWLFRFLFYRSAKIIHFQFPFHILILTK